MPPPATFVVAVATVCVTAGPVASVLIGNLPLTGEAGKLGQKQIRFEIEFNLPGVDTFEVVVVVSTCSLPSGICTSCCPGFRPRTLTLPSGPRMICTLCGVGDDAAAAAADDDVAFTWAFADDGEGLAAADDVAVEVRATCVTACCMMRVVPSGFLTITRLVPITAPFTIYKRVLN